MDKPVNVLMCGSSPSVKGGMTTVVESFLRHKFGKPIRLKYMSTHTEKGKIANSLYFSMKLAAFTAYVLLKRPKLVHLHMSERGSFIRKYILFRIAKELGRKVVMHTHGAEFKQYYLSASPSRKKQIVGLLKNADQVIALGKSWEQILREIEPETNTTILMNSVPLPAIESRSREKEVFSILFLAVLIERKGILDLIEASVPFLCHAEQLNRKVQFHIAGDGELLGSAKKSAASLGVQDHFIFHGWVSGEEKERLLKEADLFVLPSYNEGLPLSILEALSFGVPVISTDVGSVDEAVVDGVNGFLIQPGDVEALSGSLIKCLDETAMQSMSTASREIAEQKFNEINYFQKVESIYLAE